MKKFILLLFVAALFVFMHGSVAQAFTFSKGDVFAAVNSGNVQHYDGAGNLLETLNTGQGGFTTGMAFDTTGNLYVTNFSVGTVSKFTGPNDPHNTSLFGPNFGSSVESIVFDKLGNAFVSNAGSGAIIKVDSTGNVLDTFNTGMRADWIDLSADNTKIYFTVDTSKGVRILDLTNDSVSVFNPILGNFALRLLADGSVLVANQQDVRHLDSAGNDIGTYDVSGQDNFFALNLDPDGKSFWSGDFGSGQYFKFDIATTGLDNNILAVNTGVGNGSLFGLTVFGEITQGGGGNGAVPEPSTVILMGLGALGVAVMTRKRAGKLSA